MVVVYSAQQCCVKGHSIDDVRSQEGVSIA